MAPSHLVLVFKSTAGQNGENLGSDEAQIVLFVYLLYDVANNKVVTLHQHYVRPSLEDNLLGENVLTEECRIQTGLDEDAIRAAHPLEHVLDEFDRFISAKGVHPDNSGRPFVFMCDGQLHFRLCLQPEATRKNLHLPNYFYKFYDIRREFKKMYKVEVVNCIKDMLDYLGIDQSDQSMDYGVRHVQEMANVLQRMLNDGHQLEEPDIIKDKLEPGICTKDDEVDDETVIRARGLPWQSSDQDIARFFKGLNVAKGGVALCLSQQGRRNGEALIRFEAKEHRDLALRKHKHHLGQRYIEVYRATGKDFVGIAGGSNVEAVKFLQRHGDSGEQVIVRMRGLPYSCTTEQVLEFFRGGDDPCEVLDAEEGVLFVHQADGRATGDAFVLFADDIDANKALAKHRHVIGTRYIELFKSTTAEVQQVLNRSMDPRANHSEQNGHGAHDHTSQISLLPHIPPPSPAIVGMQPSVPGGVILPQQLITCGHTKDCIRMRGLPFEATVTDILTFLAEHARNIVFQGVHMVYNAQGTPSGEAFIQMDSEQNSEGAAVAKHKKFMFINGKKRFIEVFQCSGEDMNLVLTNGLLPNGLPNPLSNGLPNASLTNGLSTMMQHPPTSTAIPSLPPSSNGLTMSMQFGQSHAAAAAAAAALMGQKPLISPGGTIMSGGPLPNFQGMPPLPPHAALTQGMLQYPGSSMIPSPTPSVASTMAGNPSLFVQAGGLMANPMMAGAMMAGHGALPSAPGMMTQIPGATRPGAVPGPYGLQPMLYWYPSPPVSPQSAYYVAGSPATVVIKGLATNVTPQEILSFFDGIFEMQPDVQLPRTADGRTTGEAYITFGSRVEAERAITERNRKVLHNRFVDIHMA